MKTNTMTHTAALADEIEKEDGCTTENPETVREAANRLDEQTVTIRGLQQQRDELLAALKGMMDAYMDLCDENEPNYKSFEFRRQRWEAARAAIASVKGGAA